MPDKIYLRQMQSLPLIAKVHMSQARIREWYDFFNGNVFISFSGGKDSTALAHVVHEYYPDVPLVFCNTGLEYPEIQEFARKMGAEFIRPKMSFSEVISTYGYPIISKENAEAIHYARKIRNGGGYAEAARQRKQLNGSRTFKWGGYDPSSQTGTYGKPCFGRTGNRRNALTNHTKESAKFVGGGMTETLRRRADTMGTRKEFDIQIGVIGEDEPLPG